MSRRAKSSKTTDGAAENPIIAAARKVTAKRARIVIDHIIEHGHVTTTELREEYGYEHAPRAAADVREQGIPLETFRVKSAEGKSMGAYRFADPSEIRNHTHKGRKVFPKVLGTRLYKKQGGKCAVCSTPYERRYLQVDHRVPYQVAGDSLSDLTKIAGFMLLCGSCQRSKSWSCEHCPNGTGARDPSVCKTCYWASPENYSHVATESSRRLVIEWTGAEVDIFNSLQSRAKREGLALPDLVKSLLRD